MINISVRDAKMNFSKILSWIEKGEDVVIRDRRGAVAKVSSLKNEGGEDVSMFLDGLSKLRSSQKRAPKGHSEKGVRRDRDGRDVCTTDGEMPSCGRWVQFSLTSFFHCSPPAKPCLPPQKS
jgi:antitoxin (DNA-binding transcriptional repressor) of toxin-antitoxin stability system